MSWVSAVNFTVVGLASSRRCGFALLAVLDRCNLWSASLLLFVHFLESEEVEDFNGPWLEFKHEVDAKILVTLSKVLFKEMSPAFVTLFDSASKVTMQEMCQPNKEELVIPFPVDDSVCCSMIHGHSQCRAAHIDMWHNKSGAVPKHTESRADTFQDS